MSNFTEKLSQINAWWADEGASQSDTLQSIREEIAACDIEITGIRDRKSGLNPFKLLGNAWSRATRIPELAEQKIDFEIQRDKLTYKLSVKAADDANELLLAKANAGFSLLSHIETSETQGEYDEAVCHYVDLRSKVADSVNISKIFHGFMPKNINEETIARSADRHFNI